MTPTKATLTTTHIIGISVRTINKDRKAGTDIKNLWDRFFAEGIIDKIPNKLGTELFNVYTHYDSDHTDWYDCILGCKVSSLHDIPEGMTGITASGSYEIYTSKGELPMVVLDTWEQIWASDINRAYGADFDVYALEKMDPASSKVYTWVSVVE